MANHGISAGRDMMHGKVKGKGDSPFSKVGTFFSQPYPTCLHLSPLWASVSMTLSSSLKPWCFLYSSLLTT